jgi:hypothetical protein
MVAEDQFIAVAHLHIALPIHHLDALNELADVSRAVASVGAERSADGAEDANERFQPCQSVPRRFGDERGNGRSCAGADALAVKRDLREGRLGEAKDDARNALIANEIFDESGVVYECFDVFLSGW